MTMPANNHNDLPAHIFSPFEPTPEKLDQQEERFLLDKKFLLENLYVSGIWAVRKFCRAINHHFVCEPAPEGFESKYIQLKAEETIEAIQLLGLDNMQTSQVTEWRLGFVFTKGMFDDSEGVQAMDHAFAIHLSGLVADDEPTIFKTAVFKRTLDDDLGFDLVFGPETHEHMLSAQRSLAEMKGEAIRLLQLGLLEHPPKDIGTKTERTNGAVTTYQPDDLY